MNSLTVIPTTGLSALNQLKLSGNPQMKNVLTAKNLPKLRWEKHLCDQPSGRVICTYCGKMAEERSAGWSRGRWRWLPSCNVPASIPAKEFDVITQHSPALPSSIVHFLLSCSGSGKKNTLYRNITHTQVTDWLISVGPKKRLNLAVKNIVISTSQHHSC